MLDLVIATYAPTAKFQCLEMTYPGRPNFGTVQSFHQTESTTSQNTAVAHQISGAELHLIVDDSNIGISWVFHHCIYESQPSIDKVLLNIY